MSESLIELIRRFDAVVPAYWEGPPPPTSISLIRIEKHFSMTVPHSLVEFARNSKSFGSWFASLGPDYGNRNHIIRINSYWRQKRKTKAIPKNLVALNIGFDEDLDCFDLGQFNEGTQEYAIQYWSPGINDGTRYTDFPAYIESCVSFWENLKRKPRS
jgi:hypothetical protein